MYCEISKKTAAHFQHFDFQLAPSPPSPTPPIPRPTRPPTTRRVTVSFSDGDGTCYVYGHIARAAICLLRPVGLADDAALGARVRAKKPFAMPTLPETLVLGALLNIWLLYETAGSEAPLPVLVPARIFFVVSAFRCTFPCRYKGNVVLRDTWLSSIILTRTLATIAEVSWIYQLAWLGLALSPASWEIFFLAVGMMVSVVLAQGCVWIAVLSNTNSLMYWEELGWAAIFVLNTLINVVVVSPPASLDGPRLVSLCFGCVYLPYQLLLHVPKLYADRRVEKHASRSSASIGVGTGVCPVVSWQSARRATYFRAPTTDWQRWGGFVGAVWMVCYWGLLPLWHIYLVNAVPPNIRP